MRRLLFLAAAGSLLATGCSSESDSGTPAACLAPGSSYLEALKAAPGEVRLEGSTPIGECLVAGQDSGALSQVGKAVIAAATTLNAEARRNPGSAATVQLGYLVGAVQEGAAETGGIHADLVRRLDSAARFTESGKAPPLDFERPFGKGYAAGQASG